MSTFSKRAHKIIIWCIENAPACNLLLFRAYNAILRSIGGPRRAATYFGSIMLCDLRDRIQQMVFHFGVWEPNISALIEQVLSPGDAVADIGANIGYVTLLASKLVGPRGNVVAIEASPRIFNLLAANTSENDARNVRLVHKAVSDEPGLLDLYAGPPSNRGLTTTLAKKGLDFEATVEALPLDQILTAEERSRLRLIKMDIEGAEAPVMRRFLDTLDLYPDSVHLIVEMSPSEEWPNVFHRMRDAGFAAYSIENPYERMWYLKRRRQLTPIRVISDLPGEQTDILFTRERLPTAE
jgi:FkbM family methyltransferase